jgi:hypothetical protein
LEYGVDRDRAAQWNWLVRPVAGELRLVGRRERGAGALLAILLQVTLLWVWIRQTHVDSPWSRSGIPDAVVDIQYFAPLTAAAPRQPGPRRAPKLPPAPTITPEVNTITIPVPQPAPLPAEPQPPVEEKPVPRQPEMSERDAAEFRRQWSQLQDDMQKKAVDAAAHHNLKTETREEARQRDSEMAKLRDRDKPLETVQRERGQQTDHTNRPDSLDGNIFDGELCVTGSRAQDDVQIALPCMGDNFVTDFSWYSRLRAPKRGEPSYRPVDPNGHVYVRNYVYSPATRASFEAATVELRKIQVTMRMVYLPDLRYPFQLLSRDNNAGAIGAEAFATEAEMAAYLDNWADNVRRWTTPRVPGPGAATPATH